MKREEEEVEVVVAIKARLSSSPLTGVEGEEEMEEKVKDVKGETDRALGWMR